MPTGFASLPIDVLNYITSKINPFFGHLGCPVVNGTTSGELFENVHKALSSCPLSTLYKPTELQVMSSISFIMHA